VATTTITVTVEAQRAELYNNDKPEQNTYNTDK